MYQDLFVHLKELEEQLHTTATRENTDSVAALLTDDFREFGSSGRVYTKTEVIAALAGEPPTDITADFHLTHLAPDASLLTYRSTKRTATETKQALRSSLWVYRDGRWQILSHQGTPLP